MKKTIFLFSILIQLICFGSSAQVKKLIRNIYHEPIGNGWNNWLHEHKQELPDDGKLIVFFDSGYVHKGLEGQMKQGKKEGTWVDYHINGRKCGIKNYKEDMLDGEQTFLSYYGDTLSRQLYRNNKSEGPVTMYRLNPYTWQTYVSERGTYKEGRQTGLLFQMNWNGDTIFKVYADNGLPIKFKSTWYLMGLPSRQSVYGQQIQRKDTTFNYAFNKKPYLKLTFGGTNYTSAVHDLDNLKDCKNLRSLYIIFSNTYQEAWPVIIEKLKTAATLPKLEEIGISGDFKEIPSFIVNCKKLQRLEINNSKITALPSSIIQLTSLRSIHLIDNVQINYSQAFNLLSQMPGLKELSFTPKEELQWPTELALMKNLTSLSMERVGLCRKRSGEKSNIDLVYQLKGLRILELCINDYYAMNFLSFATRMPNCELRTTMGCFAPGTKVMLSSGEETNIENINIGDIVLAYDSINNRIDTARVHHVYVHSEPVAGLLRLVCSYNDPNDNKQEYIEVTVNHPFLTGNRIWKEAEALKEGDYLFLEDVDKKLRVVLIEQIIELTSGWRNVYNIGTTKHSYFVNHIAVHNK